MLELAALLGRILLGIIVYVPELLGYALTKLFGRKKKNRFIPIPPPNNHGDQS